MILVKFHITVDYIRQQTRNAVHMVNVHLWGDAQWCCNGGHFYRNERVIEIIRG